MEAVIEGVISCQNALAILLVSGHHFSSTVVHLPHLVQPLPSNDDSTLMTSRQSRAQIMAGGKLLGLCELHIKQGKHIVYINNISNTSTSSKALLEFV